MIYTIINSLYRFTFTEPVSSDEEESDSDDNKDEQVPEITPETISNSVEKLDNCMEPGLREVVVSHHDIAAAGVKSSTTNIAAIKSSHYGFQTYKDKRESVDSN